MGHVNLAPDFQIFGSVFQFFGDATDGGHIGGHVLAHHAVAPGGGPNQHAVFVFQATGKTVDLDFYNIFRLEARLPHPAVKVPQLVKAESIQKALHLDGVAHLGKPAAGGAAHMLGGRSLGHQLGEFGFQFAQFLGQSVVFVVFQLRRVLVVVKAVVIFNDSAQFLRAFFGLFQFQTNSLLFCCREGAGFLLLYTIKTPLRRGALCIKHKRRQPVVIPAAAR